jgi:Holliday junction resolvase RusA-like endonuclease
MKNANIGRNTMRLIINALPPSANKFIGRKAVWEYRAEKQAWHWLVKAAIRERPREPYERAVVAITYYFPDKRRRDPDNYSGKMILDPLVREGILADDSFSNVRLELSAEIDAKNPRTAVTVTAI